MKYRLVTTRKGQFPMFEIEEGTEVFCHGEWIPSPKPEQGKVTTCTFEKLPTTSFESKFISEHTDICCNHRPVLNEFEGSLTGLTVRGYLDERRKDRNYGAPGIGVDAVDADDMSYWYPRLINFCGSVMFPKIINNGRKHQMIVYKFFPKLSELHGNELSERNLEYYLEGMLRKRMYWQDNTFKLCENLNESQRMVLRLLDIDCIPTTLGSALTNPVSLLKHVKDDYNKSRITEEQIRILLIKSYELPLYTPGCRIIEKKEEIDWILPGINPDINCLSPYEFNMDFDDSKNPQIRKRIKTVKTDVLGKTYENEYRTDSLWETIYKNIGTSD